MNTGPSVDEAPNRRLRHRKHRSRGSAASADAEGHLRANRRRWFRSGPSWPHRAGRSKQWKVRYAIGALVAAQALAFVFALVLWLAGIAIPTGPSVLIMDTAFLTTLVPLYRAGRLDASDLGLRSARPASSVGLVFLGLLATGWLSALWATLVHAPAAHSDLLGIARQPTVIIILTGLASCLSAPVVEEIFFRGFLYRTFRNRMGVVPACVIVGVVFGLGHTQYPLLVRPEVAIFGVVACLLYERTGSLLPGIALHSLIDASGFERALTGSGGIVYGIFTLLALALLCLSAARCLRARRARKKTERGLLALLPKPPARNQPRRKSLPAAR
jgi:membrane protease YdiL (CAAX protease family)